MKTKAKLSAYKQQKYPDGIIVPRHMEKSFKRLKKALQSDKGGADTISPYSSYGLFALFSFHNMSFVRSLGLNTLLRLHIFYTLLYLMLDDPEKCYSYHIVRLTGIHLRSVQITLDWFERKGFCSCRHGGRNNTKYYCIELSYIERIVVHIDSVKSAKNEG